MAKRTFQFVALTSASPQPVFGSTLSAAVAPSSNPVSLPVANSVFWLKGDYILVDPLGANAETLQVSSVPDATHVVVPRLQFAHASGVFAVLSIACQGVSIQTKSANTGAIAVGSSGAMNASTGLYCIAFLPNVTSPTPPTSMSDQGGGRGNVFSTSNYWFAGTSGDAVLPSITVF